MTINRHRWVLVVVLFLTLTFLGVVYANSRIAYGNHIWISTGIQIPHGVDRLVHFRSISRIYLDLREFECQFDLHDPDERVLTGDARYHAVPSMLVFYDLFGRGLNPDDNEHLTKLTYKAISLCDTEALLHSNAPPPLIYAILTGRVDFVERIISNGANTNFRMVRPGKDSDGMTPLEYARYLLGRDDFAEMRKNYEEIVALLERNARSTRGRISPQGP